MTYRPTPLAYSLAYLRNGDVPPIRWSRAAGIACVLVCAVVLGWVL